MPKCTRRGCLQEYHSADNANDSCTYHSGVPVFHEGLKSWSCCNGVNKPVLEFDEFMKIPGCTQGPHTDEAPKSEAPKSSSNTTLKMTESAAGTEVYSSSSAPRPSTTATISAPAKPPPIIEEEDDLDVPVAVGTTCRRNGCGTTFISDEVHRKGGADESVCTYHPSPPIFREGSKGYLCCKRRVLEFEEFLKIKGCKSGRHLFVPKLTSDIVEEEANCRIDHYQTLTEVHVSVFAKQTDKERSSVKFEESQVTFDLYLPAAKRFRRTLQLFGPIDPEASSFKYFGTKVEAHLRKLDTRSWTVLEKTTQDLGNINLTFGVGGRTGTIGGKDIILDESNKAKA